MPPTGTEPDRRSFLFAAAAIPFLVGCGHRRSIGQTGRGNRGRVRFTNRLAIPPINPGVLGPDSIRRFELTAREGSKAFRSGKPSRTWGFNGDYLGPTIRASRGEVVALAVRNDLAVPTTLHWHGMRLPAVMDGNPHQPIRPGTTWEPQWTIDQPAATLWYHPHPHGETARHVYRGLAGLWIIDDPAATAELPSSYGVDDIPVVIQDRTLGSDGELIEDEPVAFWGLMGNDILVNGTLGPFVEVTTSLIRLRLLNGSNARVYNLTFADGRDLHVIANDCGMLAAPVGVRRLTISPGERFEVLVQFEPNDILLLRSIPGNQMIDQGDFGILEFRAAPRLDTTASIPHRLDAPSSITTPSRATRRSLVLAGDARIGSQSMDMERIDLVVPRGAIEEWEVWAPGVAHNFHIHDAAFTVVELGGAPPPPHLRGLKDTVFLPAGQQATLAVQFGDHPDPITPYMYHCHILRHEDAGMMGQFTIVEPEGVQSAPRRIPTRHH
jgi:FtsP/CotA-like multicopper oxidase with cupredoxin domain